MTRLTTIFLLALLSCAGPADATAQPAPAPAAEPNDTGLPWLCSLDGGRYCHECPTCPQEGSGALCCIGAICVEWTGDSCENGILGWCNNYSLSTEPNTGIEVAECHDGE